MAIKQFQWKDLAGECAGRCTWVAALVVMAVVAGLGVFAVQANALRLAGLMVILAGVVHFIVSLRMASAEAVRRGWVGSIVTLLMGVVVLGAPSLSRTGLIVAIAIWFAIDAVRNLVGFLRQREMSRLLGVLGNAAVAALLIIFRDVAGGIAIVAVSVARILGTAFEILSEKTLAAGDAKDTVVADLNLGDPPQLEFLKEQVAAAEPVARSVDGAWLVTLVLMLFGIHLSRMGFDRSSLGILSPLIAVVGDLVFALLLSFLVIVPVRIAWMRGTRFLELRVWKRGLGLGPATLEAETKVPEANAPETRGTVNRLLMGWVGGRLRFRLRLRRARYSLGQLFRTGLVVGLPAAAIVVATVPVTGMSWYFDTENWASGIWDSWAAERTDIWRSAMVQAVDPTGSGDFVLTPPGIEAGEDFSFVVVGDPGEGDISQLVLSEQIIKAASHDDVRFVVISSDVVYPTGAMRDYESKFWLPFKGVSKPVYAIPGNHDWYDALEAFNATFLTPEAARAAILARLDADGVRRRSSEADADKLIATVSRLRAEYGVPTQWQAAPFFQIQTEAFALIAIDTGISRRVDPDQLAWIERALADARGKLAMVILGHPFYAGGKDTSWDHPDFKALLDLFRREGVAVVMAGDTHDLEYYRDVEDPAEPMHHFVNGGGGAYLSLGTALSAPDEPVTEVWAHYPSRQEVSDKVEALNPLWKKPFWWWTKTFDGYPFSSEWLSAAFDYNVSPFMQSFVEVRVEVSKRRLVLIPYGVSGRLPWSQFAASAGLVENPDGLAEWVIPLAEVASDPQDEQ